MSSSSSSDVSDPKSFFSRGRFRRISPEHTKVFGELKLPAEVDDLRVMGLVASNARNLAVVTDFRRRIEWVNRAFCESTGFTLDEVKGRTPGEVLQGPETDPKVVALMRDALDEGVGFSCEIINYRKNGEPYWLSLEVQPIFDGAGEVQRFVAIETDITRVKRIEQRLIEARNQARTANQAKSEFLAHMSHELRTPLSGVLGLADLLSRSELSPTQREWLQLLQKAARHQLSLMNDLLDMARIEAGKMQFEKKPVALAALLQDVVGMFERDSTTKGLDVLVQVDPEAPAVVEVDPVRLRQVFVNLVGNAVKFTRQGSISVTVEYQADDRWRFQVADTGCGISSEQQVRLFEPFTQAAESGEHGRGGVGLGLSIVRRLIEHMGGTISMSSTAGVGTTFTIDLTLPVIEDQEFPLGNVQHTHSGHALPPLRILVADDHADNRAVLQFQLDALSQEADYVESGEQAVERLQREPYDVAILDLQMPGIGGRGVADYVKDRWRASWSRPQLVAYSADIMVGESDGDARHAPFFALLHKPATVDDIYRLLLTCVEVRRGEQTVGMEQEVPLMPGIGADGDLSNDAMALVNWGRLSELLTLARRSGGDAELLAVFRSFENDCRSRLKELDSESLTETKWKDGLHYLKGALLTLCLSRAVHSIEAVERRSAMPTAPERSDFLARLGREVDQGLAAILECGFSAPEEGGGGKCP